MLDFDGARANIVNEYTTTYLYVAQHLISLQVLGQIATVTRSRRLQGRGHVGRLRRRRRRLPPVGSTLDITADVGQGYILAAVEVARATAADDDGPRLDLGHLDEVAGLELARTSNRFIRF